MKAVGRQKLGDVVFEDESLQDYTCGELYEIGKLDLKKKEQQSCGFDASASCFNEELRGFQNSSSFSFYQNHLLDVIAGLFHLPVCRQELKLPSDLGAYQDVIDFTTGCRWIGRDGGSIAGGFWELAIATVHLYP